MTAEQIAERLLAASDAKEATRCLRDSDGIGHLELAYAVKDRCYELWTNEPRSARRANTVLQLINAEADEPEVQALTDWIQGISEITEGKLDDALTHLSAASKSFLVIDRKTEAAQTKVAQLIPLGLLGRYDEAVSTGNEALAVFVEQDDALAAGKIEMNLAIISSRQGKHSESLEYCISASKRFRELGESSWLLMAENDLAIALAELNRFDEAEKRYVEALEIARDEDQHLTEAELLASLGNLQTYRGRYGEALRNLELSRQKYDEIEMPHRSVIADLEIAEVHQLLNLTDEASAIYDRVTKELSDYGLRGEEARARLNYGRLSVQTGEYAKAAAELERALELFELESNPSGSASARLLKARLLNNSKDRTAAMDELNAVLGLIDREEHPRLALETEFFRGELLRKSGEADSARKLFETVLDLAGDTEQKNLVTNALVSLAKISISEGSLESAKKFLSEAIDTVEKLRDPIPAEIFRMSFLADKLAPYKLSAELAIETDQIAEAFVLTERSRARTLFEKLNGGESTAEGKEEKSIREKLNWYYSRLAKDGNNDVDLRERIEDLEQKLASINLSRSNISESNSADIAAPTWDGFVERIQNLLGVSKTLIEFHVVNSSIAAFVLDQNGIRHFQEIGTENEIIELIEGLRFQFETLRFGDQKGFDDQLRERTNAYLGELYDLLIRPLETEMEDQSLVIVPVGPLFYVPFNALFDGKQYLVEKSEVLLSPSAAIWFELQSTESLSQNRSLVIAYADEKSPQITIEGKAASDSLQNSSVFTGKEAGTKVFFDHAGTARDIHLACHGEFRADNPMFSNLRLADGFLTVEDISKSRLNADLVTLSACETGLSRIYAGEEILGLSRGFIGAGARNVVMSLWTVNDASTVELMKEFYAEYNDHRNPLKALRVAQRQLISHGYHPYYWSPFVIIGK
ncbi:MAG: CHAT domain-containing protein [Pyrinomonadaceae bacterium]|nr:CHAT domain-containing protein [Pyrinomonadaceae bacterium]